MLRVGQGILAGNVKLIKADVMEEHIDAAQVVGGDVDFLTVEAVAQMLEVVGLQVIHIDIVLHILAHMGTHAR